MEPVEELHKQLTLTDLEMDFVAIIVVQGISILTGNLGRALHSGALARAVAAKLGPEKVEGIVDKFTKLI
jgi:hypothetical protein